MNQADCPHCVDGLPVVCGECGQPNYCYRVGDVLVTPAHALEPYDGPDDGHLFRPAHRTHDGKGNWGTTPCAAVTS